MNSRLLQFLSAENITQSQFADTIGVARASVSHILSGRNKPSYEFITAMLRHYPQLNPEWLMLGSGRMYKDSGRQAQQTVEIPEDQLLFPTDLESSNRQSAETEADSSAARHSSSEVRTAPSQTLGTGGMPQQTDRKPSTEETTISGKVASAVRFSGEIQRNISKIIVFFDDGTFQELH